MPSPSSDDQEATNLIKVGSQRRPPPAGFQAGRAAAQLARLAAAEVRAAHPREWYALTELSDAGPIVAGGETVRLSRPRSSRSRKRVPKAVERIESHQQDPAVAARGLGG